MFRDLQSVQHSTAIDSVLISDAQHAVVVGGGDGYRTVWHRHDCWMLLLPVCGAIRLRHEDSRSGTWLTGDRFALIPPLREHETEAVRVAHQHVAIYATDDFLTSVGQNISAVDGKWRRPKYTSIFDAGRDLRTIQRLCANRNRGLANATKRHLGAALLTQCVTLIAQNNTVISVNHEDHGAAFVSEVAALVREQLQSEFSLDELADRFGISRRHITRLFKEHTGQSIGEFRQAARVDAASQLLQQTDLPIGEIAFRVGLESGATLARLTRRASGRSPSSIRTTAWPDRSSQKAQ